MLSQEMDDEVVVGDYQTYVRLRSLNTALSTAAVWAGAWLAAGCVVLVAGSLLHSEADLVALDPAGRGYEVKMTGIPGQQLDQVRN
jgi:hypothetical protein